MSISKRIRSDVEAAPWVITVIEQLEAALSECQKDRDYYKANDRCAMSYLAEVRSIVGGDDFPDMVKRVAEAKEAIRLLRESLRSCISLSRLGSELRDEALEKTEKWK